MGMYSDTTEQVFKRVLELLQTEVPGSALQKIQECIQNGTFEDVDAVLNAIEEASSGVEANGNS
jgi:hypothetical protein